MHTQNLPRGYFETIEEKYTQTEMWLIESFTHTFFFELIDKNPCIPEQEIFDILDKTLADYQITIQEFPNLVDTIYSYIRSRTVFLDTTRYNPEKIQDFFCGYLSLPNIISGKHEEYIYGCPCISLDGNEFEIFTQRYKLKDIHSIIEVNGCTITIPIGGKNQHSPIIIVPRPVSHKIVQHEKVHVRDLLSPSFNHALLQQKSGRLNEMRPHIISYFSHLILTEVSAYVHDQMPVQEVRSHISQLYFKIYYRTLKDILENEVDGNAPYNIQSIYEELFTEHNAILKQELDRIIEIATICFAHGFTIDEVTHMLHTCSKNTHIALQYVQNMHSTEQSNILVEKLRNANVIYSATHPQFTHTNNNPNNFKMESTLREIVQIKMLQLISAYIPLLSYIGRNLSLLFNPLFLENDTDNDS